MSWQYRGKFTKFYKPIYLKKNCICIFFFKGEFIRNILNPRTKYSKSKSSEFSLHNCKSTLHAFVLATMLNDAYITKGKLQQHASYEYTK